MLYRVLSFCIYVQSSKYDPVYLLGRIDNFINGVEGLLDVLDDESFEKYKNGLIAKKLEKDPSLSYETVAIFRVKLWTREHAVDPDSTLVVYMVLSTLPALALKLMHNGCHLISRLLLWSEGQCLSNGWCLPSSRI
ncbi:hypothetical protein IFM89_000632 [Coptis chinensis]|uniref:Coenzyme PQQ synthesis protein F-like C-terminal lobe domain-containing protein n=1 Tax=Coptis chinensis TaxID=261450 RepID=A0A835HA47_9MAGN|nr:hypothetical protein IFM89_000632 [Coptis chinensis]